MPRLVVRHATARRPLAGPALIGFAIGMVAGVVLGELWAPTAEAALRRPTFTGPTLAELVRDAQAALARDPLLGALDINVVPSSRRRVELRGWVESRALRARAHRVCSEAIGTDAVVNGILVHGEDDTDLPNLDVVSA